MHTYLFLSYCLSAVYDLHSYFHVHTYHLHLDGFYGSTLLTVLYSVYSMERIDHWMLYLGKTDTNLIEFHAIVRSILMHSEYYYASI